MPIGYKRRKYLAFLSVSASGPEFSPILEEGGRFLHPRMAADLRYTTADANFLESHFREPNYDSGEEEFHRRLRNPTRGQFFQALHDIRDWLGGFRDNADWDGGGIQLCFAGHGRQGDGALVLADGVVTPNEFVGSLADTASSVSRPGRLRVSAVLDSCHSGAFTTEVLEACFSRLSNLLVPFHVFASCMEDEFAWEESGLGHGIFSYCFSVREQSPGSLAAEAIQPDNTFGPSLGIARGELGCSLLTAGAQNPVVYWNGTGHLEVCRRDIDLFADGKCMSLQEMRARLRRERDEVVEVIRPMRPDTSFGSGISDEEMRADIQQTIQLLTTHRSAPQLGILEG